MKLGSGLFVVIMLAGIIPAQAESGISPSGRFKIVVMENNPDSAAESVSLEFYDLKTKKCLRRIENAGTLPARQKIKDILLWHPDRDILALITSGGKHDSQLRIYSLIGGRLHELPVPDYVMNALGRVHALRIYNTCLIEKGAWSGNSLGFNLEFNVRDKPEEFGLYSAKIILTVNDPSSAGGVSLDKVFITQEFRPGN